MFGLDELPQLINVLRGEMSMVGPRPCVPSEFQLYNVDHYRRFAVQPGLTGLWQVERTQSTTFHEMVGMDIAYVDRLSPWSDFKILMKTPVSLVLQFATHSLSKVCKSAAWKTERTSA
jgi:lipopolysaccharide/colanic/teichoic acid biosynthesis glycosyltransferase